MTSEQDRDPDYRFTLANERTFLAWIRTALALLAGGVAVVQILPPFAFPGARQALGLVLMLMGGGLALASVRRWRRVQAAMRHDEDLPSTRVPMALGFSLTVLAGILAFILILPAK